MDSLAAEWYCSGQKLKNDCIKLRLRHKFYNYVDLRQELKSLRASGLEWEALDANLLATLPLETAAEIGDHEAKKYESFEIRRSVHNATQILCAESLLRLAKCPACARAHTSA